MSGQRPSKRVRPSYDEFKEPPARRQRVGASPTVEEMDPPPLSRDDGGVAAFERQQLKKIEDLTQTVVGQPGGETKGLIHKEDYAAGLGRLQTAKKNHVQRLKATIEKAQQNAKKPHLRVTAVGAPGAGKSYLFNSLSHGIDMNEAARVGQPLEELLPSGGTTGAGLTPVTTVVQPVSTYKEQEVRLEAFVASESKTTKMSPEDLTTLQHLSTEVDKRNWSSRWARLQLEALVATDEVLVDTVQRYEQVVVRLHLPHLEKLRVALVDTPGLPDRALKLRAEKVFGTSGGSSQSDASRKAEELMLRRQRSVATAYRTSDVLVAVVDGLRPASAITRSLVENMYKCGLFAVRNDHSKPPMLVVAGNFKGEYASDDKWKGSFSAFDVRKESKHRVDAILSSTIADALGIKSWVRVAEPAPGADDEVWKLDTDHMLQFDREVFDDLVYHASPWAIRLCSRPGTGERLAGDFGGYSTLERLQEILDQARGRKKEFFVRQAGGQAMLLLRTLQSVAGAGNSEYTGAAITRYNVRLRTASARTTAIPEGLIKARFSKVGDTLIERLCQAQTSDDEDEDMGAGLGVARITGQLPSAINACLEEFSNLAAKFAARIFKAAAAKSTLGTSEACRTLKRDYMEPIFNEKNVRHMVATWQEFEDLRIALADLFKSWKWENTTIELVEAWYQRRDQRDACIYEQDDADAAPAQRVAAVLSNCVVQAVMVWEDHRLNPYGDHENTSVKISANRKKLRKLYQDFRKALHRPHHRSKLGLLSPYPQPRDYSAGRSSALRCALPGLELPGDDIDAAGRDGVGSDDARERQLERLALERLRAAAVGAGGGGPKLLKTNDAFCAKRPKTKGKHVSEATHKETEQRGRELLRQGWRKTQLKLEICKAEELPELPKPLPKQGQDELAGPAGVTIVVDSTNNTVKAFMSDVVRARIQAACAPTSGKVDNTTVESKTWLAPVFVTSIPRDHKGPKTWHANLLGMAFEACEGKRTTPSSDLTDQSMLGSPAVRSHVAATVFAFVREEDLHRYPQPKGSNVVFVAVRAVSTNEKSSTPLSRGTVWGVGRIRKLIFMFAAAFDLDSGFLADDDISAVLEWEARLGWSRHMKHPAAMARCLLFTQQLLHHERFHVDENGLAVRRTALKRISDVDPGKMMTVAKAGMDKMKQYVQLLTDLKDSNHLVAIARNPMALSRPLRVLRRECESANHSEAAAAINEAVEAIDALVHDRSARVGHVAVETVMTRNGIPLFGTWFCKELVNRAGLDFTHQVANNRDKLVLVNFDAVADIHPVTDEVLFEPLLTSEQRAAIKVPPEEQKTGWHYTEKGAKAVRTGYQGSDFAHVRYMLLHKVSGYNQFRFLVTTHDGGQARSITGRSTIAASAVPPEGALDEGLVEWGGTTGAGAGAGAGAGTGAGAGSGASTDDDTSSDSGFSADFMIVEEP